MDVLYGLVGGELEYSESGGDSWVAFGVRVISFGG